MASRVIIVDDDAAVRKALARLVRTAGYRVDGCASAEEYLAREPVGPPACLVLDIRMPGMSGLDLLRAVEGMPLSLPTIVITGHGDEDDRQQARALGAVEVLDKPIDQADLLTAIARALAESPPD